jgi:hypothetical protein
MILGAHATDIWRDLGLVRRGLVFSTGCFFLVETGESALIYGMEEDNHDLKLLLWYRTQPSETIASPQRLLIFTMLRRILTEGSL